VDPSAPLVDLRKRAACERIGEPATFAGFKHSGCKDYGAAGIQPASAFSPNLPGVHSAPGYEDQWNMNC
jgi:hypothetical protein